MNPIRIWSERHKLLILLLRKFPGHERQVVKSVDVPGIRSERLPKFLKGRLKFPHGEIGAGRKSHYGCVLWMTA